MNTLTELCSNSIAQRIGWALIHFLWQGLAVALLLAVTLALLRNRSAQARWIASCAALALMAALPVATALMVSVEVPPQPEPAPAAITANVIATPSPGGAVELPMEPASPPLPSLAHSPEPSQPAPRLAQPAPTPQGKQTAAVSWPQQLQGWVQPVLPWAVPVWLAGVILMSIWHFGGWLQVRRMERLGTHPARPAVQETFARLLQRLGVRRTVRLMESLRVAVPVVVGWLRPVVLLPVSAITGLTPPQLEAILAHELAHVRRWDCLVQALAAVMETLLFYHPALWWVSRQIRQESEQCCDDLAVGICGDRRGYAHALAKVAELAVRGPAFAPAATGGKLLPRIRRLLGAEGPAALSFGRGLSGVLALAAIIAIGLAVGVSCSSGRGPQTDLAEKPATQPTASSAPVLESDWGPAEQGVQIRLRARQTVWAQGQLPQFLVDMRNEGLTKQYNLQNTSWDLQVDGHWYTSFIVFLNWPIRCELGPRQQVDGVEFAPQPNWEMRRIDLSNPREVPYPSTAVPLVLAPGKHTVRVAFRFYQAELRQIVRPVSGSMEIEVRGIATSASQPTTHPTGVFQQRNRAELLAFSPDGRELAVNDVHEGIRLIEVPTGRLLRKIQTPGYSANSMTFSPDGSLLAAGTNTGEVWIWDARTLELRATIPVDKWSIYAIAMSPDQSTLAASTGPARVALWNCTTGQKLRTLGQESADVKAMTFSPDGKMLVTVVRDGRAEAWDVATGRQIGTLPKDGDGYLASVCFCPDGKRVAIGRGGPLSLWDPASGEASVIQLPDAIDAMKRSMSMTAPFDGLVWQGHTFPAPSCTRAATITEDGSIAIWDIRSRTVLRVLASPKVHVMGGGIDALTFSADGRTLATGDSDGHVEMWTLGEELGTAVATRPAVRPTSTPATQAMPSAARAFGPAIKLTVRSFDTDKTDSFIDLDAGRLLTPPGSVTMEAPRGQLSRVWEPGLQRWVALNGADVGVMVNRDANGRWTGQIVGIDLRAMPVPPEQWETLSPQELHTTLLKLARQSTTSPVNDRIFLDVQEGQKATFAFLTTEGTVGLLQVAGFTDDPVGLKVLVKTVTQPATQPATGNASKANPPITAADVADYHKRLTGEDLPREALKKLYTDQAMQYAQTRSDPHAFETGVRRALAFSQDEVTLVQLHVYLGDAYWRQTTKYTPEIWRPQRLKAAQAYLDGLAIVLRHELPAEPPELPGVNMYEGGDRPRLSSRSVGSTTRRWPHARRPSACDSWFTSGRR